MTILWKGAHPLNYQRGRSGRKPQAICIHIMSGHLLGTDAWFLTPAAQRGNGAGASSAHYGIGKLGEVHQYVKEEDAAFHAGRIIAPSAEILKEHRNESPNLWTIGIEHEGTAESEWPDEMYEASSTLIAEIAKRWSIPLDRKHVIGHREIDAVNRRNCPGKCDLNLLIALAQQKQAEPVS